MSTSPRLTHVQRERAIINDLEASFPNFAGQPLSWIEVPDGRDPPDFLSSGGESIGLELIEWLDGAQMGPAKTREARRKEVLRILATSWEKEYQPQNFRGAFIAIKQEKIAHSDERQLRKEFYACSAGVDRTWLTNPERTGGILYLSEFPDFPLLGKYFSAIRYIGGEPHGLCWIDTQGDGGAYDPAVTIQTLEQAINKKLQDYATAQKQAHLKAHRLTALWLLIHGGFSAFAYNTPSGPLSLEDIARSGSAYYAGHTQRQVFDRVLFYDSLDSADEINQLIGLPSGYGRMRWLAQIWPSFSIYPGSLP